MNKNKVSKLFLTLVLGIFTITLSAQTKITSLRCEYMMEPMGVDVTTPRFTWRYHSNKDFSQAYYQLNIATAKELLQKDKADVWISDKMKSEHSYAIYAGAKALKSHSKYYWKITSWNKDEKQISSEVASFETAKINKSDWAASWISDEYDKTYRPSPLFRKIFTSSKPVKQARIYVSGLGYYEMFINGIRVGKNYLDPGYTHFDKRVLYTTYDVTTMLRTGSNVIAAVLGNGWFNMQSIAVWNFDLAGWRNRPQMICELRIEYSDGTIDTVVTDKTWKTNTGAYIFNSLYSGDIYDARLEGKGWTTVKFNDDKWKSSRVVKEPAPLLVSQLMPAIRTSKEVEPVSIKAFGKNVYIFDMGVNMAGFCRLIVKGKAGTKITLKHGEKLDNNGRVDLSNITVHYHRTDQTRDSIFSKPFIDPNEIFQTDTYILKGNGEEIFTPSFSYHGFQYVEVESSEPVTLSKETLTALFLHSDVQPVGKFGCSNDLLNRIWKATSQSYLSNLYSIPTDCPQREKNGWTADAWMSIDVGLLNYDGLKVYEKWMNDVIDNQQENGAISGIIPSAGWGFGDGFGPVWTAVMFIIPNTLDRYYGDIQTIEKVYPVCEKYLRFLKTREKDGIIEFGLGDWVPFKTKTPEAYTSTCFYYLDNVLMAEFASKIGKDAKPYHDKAEALKELINKKFFIPDSAKYANGSQTSLATALYLNIVPKGYEQKVADRLMRSIKETNYHLDFGMLGSKFVPAMLTRYGYVDDAYKMVAQETSPSWGEWIKERGLTTLPETWVPTKGDASLNHIFLGDISAWMINTLAGINYDDSKRGFRHIIIHPHFVKDLDWVKGEYQSVNGTIKSEWKRKGEKVVLNVSIPANTSATVYIDKPTEITAGTYTFTINQ